MATGIGVPNASGFKGALMGYLYGAGGGLVYKFASQFLGSSLLGSVASAAVAGAVIKGEEGKIIATVLGFQGMMSGTGLGSIFNGGASASTKVEEI
jgi:hypothetical protein